MNKQKLPIKKSSHSLALPEDIRAGSSIELLKALHILTRDGKLNQDSRRKLKQVYHLAQFIEPLIADVCDTNAEVCLVDHGAGKSYLGFILYDLFLKHINPQPTLYGIETRDTLVQQSTELAQRLGFERMRFLNLSVEDSMTSTHLPDKVNIVTALHACNTATDDSIAFGIKKHAKHLVLVPCCQAEVASVLRSQKNQMLGKTTLSELWRHPIHSREFGSHTTNVLRCLQLQAHGYQVTVTELIGWEHSMKNELIVATKTQHANPSAALRLNGLLESLGLQGLATRFFTV